MHHEGVQPPVLKRYPAHKVVHSDLAGTIGTQRDHAMGFERLDAGDGRAHDEEFGRRGGLQQRGDGLEERQRRDRVDLEGLAHILEGGAVQLGHGRRDAGVGDDEIEGLDAGSLHGLDRLGRVLVRLAVDLDEDQPRAARGRHGLEAGRRRSRRITYRRDDGVVGPGQISLGEATADAWAVGSRWLVSSLFRLLLGSC